MDLTLKERLLQFTDWATVLFLGSFVVIAINRVVYYTRFSEFVKIAFSNKYLKVYKDNSNLTNTFTMSFFFVQLISFSFLILLLLHQFENVSKNDFITYIQVFTFLLVFILSKFLIEKIIGVVFEIEDFVEQFNLQKVGYRIYFGVLLLPVVVLLYYNTLTTNFVYLSIVGILLFFNILTYITIIRQYQNLMMRKIFYFILYLCTLEIAPYYFIYYWITKN